MCCARTESMTGVTRVIKGTKLSSCANITIQNAVNVKKMQILHNFTG